MLVNMKEMLLSAMANGYAVPQFNINNLEWTKYILEECEINKSPVILGVSEGAIKYMGGYNVVSNMVKGLICDLGITIPVALHLDHGSSFDSCKKAIDAGFTSIMIDASKYELDENILVTKSVVEISKSHNVTVEAEVGHVGGAEDTVVDEIAYAKVEDCVRFVNETKIDFLAPALGSVHGIYKGEPKLDFERMSKIKELVKLPLVLHGGTGIPDDKIRQAIICGICKININTELQLSWNEAVREFVSISEAYDPRKIIKSGEKAMKETIKNKILLFGSNDRV